MSSAATRCAWRPAGSRRSSRLKRRSSSTSIPISRSTGCGSCGSAIGHRDFRLQISDCRLISDLEISDFCREIETYLCRKNDGHLIRVTGPSFDLVAGWAAQGVPIKVAFKGIDRYFERYYRKGPRRRPVKIDFCEADVLDAFEEWRRAIGVAAPNGGTPPEQPAVARRTDPAAAAEPRHPLVEHLQRVVVRLTSARSVGSLDAGFDPLIDGVSVELDVARSAARGLRGGARQALIERLDV